MKVVIISRVIYPSSSPRALRATELAREFAKRGFDVHLYAMLDKNYDYTEFIHENNLTLHELGPVFFFNNLGYPQEKKQKKKKTLIADKIVHFLRKSHLAKLLKYLFNIPDIELALKVKNKLKKEQKIDLLISIAVPHSIHWGVAWFLKSNKENKINCWMADCGDPFMGNPLQKTPFYFKYLERLFCTYASKILVPVEGAKLGYYPKFHHKINIVPQGFDIKKEKDLVERLKRKSHMDDSDSKKKIKFLYAGDLYSGKRDLTLFLSYLSSLESFNFEFLIYTSQQELVTPFLNKLGGKIKLHGRIPRDLLLEKMCTMDFLINIENPSPIQVPSKLIDFSIVNKPVLNIRSDYLNKNVIKQFFIGNYKNSMILPDVAEYDIHNIVNQLLLLYK